MTIAGIMSGSSLDGLDIAVVHFYNDQEWKLIWSHDVPYTDVWVQRLKNYHRLSASEYVELKSDYSNYIAGCLIEVFGKYDGDIDYISFHGHTLIHLPEKGITEQIGNGGTLAALLEIPTITDFRIQDVAKGGVGTPLAPIVEINLFQGHNYYLNLGGIANITSVNDQASISAYDVCPCNQVLNYFSNQAGKDFDEDGQMAKLGSEIKEMINYLDAIPYFSQSAPKSLDNNWIMKEFISGFPAGSIEDILHTYTTWMAKRIATEIAAVEGGTSLMVSGGGAHNTYFMDCLKKELAKKGCELHIPSKVIIDYKEAILMSLMARKYLLSEVNVLSSVTGAHSDSVGGAMYKV